MRDTRKITKEEEEALVERRFADADLEIRAHGDEDVPRILMRIPYNVETEVLWFREVIRPGAFAKAIGEAQDVVAWYQHGAGGALPLGRTTAGTLELRDTPTGLEAEARPPDRPWVQDLIAAINRREINGSSFAFGDTRERWTEEPDEIPLREILETSLWDVSPVVFPAYPNTDAQVRSSAELVFQTYSKNRIDLAVQGDRETNVNRGSVQGVEILRRRLELVELEVRYHLRESRS
jgi:HK97 family phage prohead protease